MSFTISSIPDAQKYVKKSSTNKHRWMSPTNGTPSPTSTLLSKNQHRGLPLHSYSSGNSNGRAYSVASTTSSSTTPSYLEKQPEVPQSEQREKIAKREGRLREFFHRSSSGSKQPQVTMKSTMKTAYRNSMQPVG